MAGVEKCEIQIATVYGQKNKTPGCWQVDREQVD